MYIFFIFIFFKYYIPIQKIISVMSIWKCALHLFIILNAIFYIIMPIFWWCTLIFLVNVYFIRNKNNIIFKVNLINDLIFHQGSIFQLLQEKYKSIKKYKFYIFEKYTPMYIYEIHCFYNFILNDLTRIRNIIIYYLNITLLYIYY